MSQRERDGQILAPNGSIASANKRKGSPSQQDGDSSFLKENGDGDSQPGETMIFSIPQLPEDIWHHIHSLMPLCDAARVACLSRAFLRSWRCYPNLTLNEHEFSLEARRGGFSNLIDCVMRNHSGIGVKIFKLELFCAGHHNIKSWLRVAVKPGIEELTLRPCHVSSKKKYKFTCSLLSDGVRNSIRFLELRNCTFRPTSDIGPLRCLTSLHLSHVHIMGDELENLLSNSLALEKLELIECEEIISLRISRELRRFGCLRNSFCESLKLIESKAPNLSSLEVLGKPELSLGEALKNFNMYHSNFLCYARTELPSIMPNLDTLYLSCDYEVPKEPMKDELISGHTSDLRQMDEDQHQYLKNVKITGFSSVKSLVELTCYILKNAVSLECLTLDTHYGFTRRCSDPDTESRQCFPVGNSLKVKRRALVAIRKFIEDKVSAGVKLTVVEPCSRCH